MRNLILLSVLFVSLFSNAQIATTTDGYTLRSFDYLGDSYLFLDGTGSDIYCLDGATEKRVDIIGNVHRQGGGITLRLEVGGDRYEFTHQSYGQRVSEDIRAIETYPSPGVRDVTKFYRIVNGTPELIADPDWAFCFQNDYRLPELTSVRGVRYYGTSYDGVGRVNGVDPLPVGLYVDQRYFRWEVIESENTYRLTLLSGRNDAPGDNTIDVVFDQETGGVISIDGRSISRAYSNYSYVSALVTRARELF